MFELKMYRPDIGIAYAENTISNLYYVYPRKIGTYMSYVMNKHEMFALFGNV